MAITRHTHELRLQGPVYSPPPLNGFFATIPFHFAVIAAGADRRVLESRRKQLVAQYSDYSWEQVEAAALDVWRGKRLRGEPTESAFLTEVATWKIYHHNTVELAGRK